MSTNNGALSKIVIAQHNVTLLETDSVINLSAPPLSLLVSDNNARQPPLIVHPRNRLPYLNPKYTTLLIYYLLFVPNYQPFLQVPLILELPELITIRQTKLNFPPFCRDYILFSQWRLLDPQVVVNKHNGDWMEEEVKVCFM